MGRELRMMRRWQSLAVVGLVLAGMGGLSLAGGLDDVLKGILNGAQQPTKPQTMSPPPQQAPAPQQAPSSQKPGDQLAQALLGGRTSPEEERQIGRQIAGNLLGASPLVRDEALQRYVNRVGRWVAMQSERPDLPWRFGVIDTEDINAFAAPGGYVFITKGLYKKLENEAELAGVLGHEVGHVIKKHHLKLLQQTQMVSALGGLLGQKLKDQNQVVQNLIGNGAEIVARSLDKEAEFEADRIGMVLAARAGYDAYALPAVLQEIGHVPDKDNRLALLYKTHPHPDDRIARLSDAVETGGNALPDGKLVENRLYRLR